MRSHRAKVLHELAGKPLLDHVLDQVRALSLSSLVVVTGFDADRVEALVEDRARTVRQPGVLGTGDAVRRALSVLDPDVDRVLVLYGDGPLVPRDLLAQLLEEAEAHDGAVLVTAEMADPSGYGRIVRGGTGAVVRIVEEKDAGAPERAIHEINTGIGVWPRRHLERILPDLPEHGQEQYLTDAVAALLDSGVAVTTILAPEPERVMGINTRAQLAQAEAILRRDTLARLMEAGVTLLDPATTFIDREVVIGMDTVIQPMTTIRGHTTIGEGARIGPMATLVDSELGDQVVVGPSVIEGSRLMAHVSVGPYSHLRAGTYLERDVHIGNYVELKNARMGLGSKAGHHCYLGDVTIGSHVNIGAGTVVVNYDGVHKHPTFIGDDAFIGCNVNLVAPVEIGRGAYVAAGSTVDHAVPADALAIARARQETKTDWARTRRESQTTRK
jgi:bifunctional UDP-N-acetylglucosamine pyrophosphorylase/glucosamine-1-phosphate N-acetyltransferase